MTVLFLAGLLAAASPSLRECKDAVDLAADPVDGYHCLLSTGYESARLAEVSRWLEERVARDPSDRLAQIALGRVYWSLRDERGESILRRAGEEATAAGDDPMAYNAWLPLVQRYAAIGEFDEAALAAVRARVAAENLGSPERLAPVLVEEARALVLQTRSLTRARDLLDEAECIEDLRDEQRIYIHKIRGGVEVKSGQLEQARRTYAAGAELAEEANRRQEAADLWFNWTATMPWWLRKRSASELAETLARLRRLVALGGELGRPGLIARAQIGLADLVDPPATAIANMERCVDLDDRINPIIRADCLRTLAQLRAASDPVMARRHAEEALELMAEIGELDRYSESLRISFRVFAQAGDLHGAAAEGMAWIESVEALRLKQSEALMRARVATRRAVSVRVAAHLIEVNRLDLAFQVADRLRARGLKDALSSSTGLEATSVADVKRSRARLQATDRFINPAQPTLDAVQAKLDAGELFIVYGLSPEVGADAWVIAITREETSATILGSGADLTTAIEAYAGLLSGGEEPPHAATAALRDRLLPPVGDGVRRVTIVPDGAVHRVPWSLLLHDRSVAIAPSVRWWLRRLEESDGLVARRSIALADPMPLDPIPFGRREAASVERHLGVAGLRLIGSEANGDRLRSALDEGAGVLHFATHAELPAGSPEAGFLVLAGGPLDASALAQLDLRDTIVVLAACRGGDGLVLPGEGLLGLSRAALQGGARDVVANNWPTDDRASARFFDLFYAALNDGRTVDDALARAQSRLRAQGRPAHEWAGWYVAGTGRTRVDPRPPWDALLITLGLVLIALGFGLLRLGGASIRTGARCR